MKLDIDPRAESMDSVALHCRSENHHWKRIHELVTETTRKGIIKILEVTRECRNCEGERIDTYSLPTFALVRRKYRYSENYRMKSKGRRLYRSDWNAAYLSRELKELLNG